MAKYSPPLKTLTTSHFLDRVFFFFFFLWTFIICPWAVNPIKAIHQTALWPFTFAPAKSNSPRNVSLYRPLRSFVFSPNPIHLIVTVVVAWETIEANLPFRFFIWFFIFPPPGGGSRFIHRTVESFEVNAVVMRESGFITTATRWERNKLVL